MNWQIRAFRSEASLETVDHGIDGNVASSCQMSIRSVPGAPSVRLLVLKDFQPFAQFELVPSSSVAPGAPVTFTLEATTKQVRVVASPHVVHRLPLAALLPQPPLLLKARPRDCSVLVLVDASSRLIPADPVDARTQGWKKHVDDLCLLLAGLGRIVPATQVGVCMFWDSPDPDPLAARPDTLTRLLPFQALNVEQVRRTLLELAPSGAHEDDFVDALAEALAETALLPWPPSERKLLIVTGDSPGHSIFYPPPPRTDIHSRVSDVDHEVSELCKRGVEVATIFHDPPPSPALLGEAKKLVDFASEQYRRVASLPGYAFRTGDSAAQSALLSLLERPPTLMAKWPCLGFDLSVKPR